MHRLLTRLYGIFDRVRQDPLRRYIYLLLLPWFIPVVSYLIFGDALLVSGWTFLSGITIILVLCIAANEADTYALKRVIAHYPHFHQTAWRLAWMALAFSILNGLLTEISLRFFHLTHFLEYTYKPDTNTWVLSFVLISSVVAAALIESAYAYTQWQANQLDKQGLEQENLRIQLDALKSQINPHFLFNSLNSVSSLIADEPEQAEEFVDELSKVYRYMLQANKSPLVALSEEVRFVRSYAQLLKARFSQALFISLRIDPTDEAGMLPPLSLQILIDQIIHQNTSQVRQPLRIEIKTTGTNRLWVSHNRQPRTILVDRPLPGLTDVAARYRWVSQETVTVENTDQETVICLPLLAT